MTLIVQLTNKNDVIFEKQTKIYTTVSRLRIDNLENVKFWWSKGFGEPNLYTATVQISPPAQPKQPP